MNIVLHQPYSVLPKKIAKYTTHYGITSEKFLVVPIKDYGTDVSCDVRWEDEQGMMQVRQQVVFSKENLVKLNGLLENKLQEIYSHYYEDKVLS